MKTAIWSTAPTSSPWATRKPTTPALPAKEPPASRPASNRAQAWSGGGCPERAPPNATGAAGSNRRRLFLWTEHGKAGLEIDHQRPQAGKSGGVAADGDVV